MGEVVGSDAGQQRFRALNRANRVRLARAELKRRIGAGALTAAEVIRECPWQAQNMSVNDVLKSQRRWGAARCRRLLMSVGIPEDKTVGTLTERQRAALVGMLGGTPGDGTAPDQPNPSTRVTRERVLSPA